MPQPVGAATIKKLSNLDQLVKILICSDCAIEHITFKLITKASEAGILCFTLSANEDETIQAIMFLHARLCMHGLARKVLRTSCDIVAPPYVQQFSRKSFYNIQSCRVNMETSVPLKDCP